MDYPSIERRRDIVVKTDVDGVCCLFSIEHQSTIDKNMVIRYGNYEMTEYLKQLKNKKLKRLVSSSYDCLLYRAKEMEKTFNIK